MESSVKCRVWSVECKVRSVECNGVLSEECGVCVCVECRGVRSAKCSVEFGV